jgi:hypothetical protein
MFYLLVNLESDDPLLEFFSQVEPCQDLIFFLYWILELQKNKCVAHYSNMNISQV